MDLPSAFRTLGEWAEESSPLYEHLCREIADDPAILDLAADVPPDRWAPHITLSAVHYLLLNGADHPLASFYPSVSNSPRNPTGAYPHSRDFCLARADDLRPLLRRRRTQSNAVGRCAALYPAFCHIAQQVSEPLALLELGSSAGLNLNWDRYAYTYDGERYGRPSAAVTVESTVRAGEPPLQETAPNVSARLGIDLNPLDLTDPDDAAWLRALIWPEHPDRLELLEAAIAASQESPPKVVTGDAVETLEQHASKMPDDATLVVYYTALLYQLPEEQQTELRRVLAAIGENRPVWWLSGDGETDEDGTFGLDITRFPGDETIRLGRYEQHGRWIEWS